MARKKNPHAKNSGSGEHEVHVEMDVLESVNASKLWCWCYGRVLSHHLQPQNPKWVQFKSQVSCFSSNSLIVCPGKQWPKFLGPYTHVKMQMKLQALAWSISDCFDHWGSEPCNGRSHSLVPPLYVFVTAFQTNKSILKMQVQGIWSTHTGLRLMDSVSGFYLMSNRTWEVSERRVSP